MKIEGIPKGYKAVRYGYPKLLDQYLKDDGTIHTAYFTLAKLYMVVTEVELTFPNYPVIPGYLVRDPKLRKRDHTPMCTPEPSERRGLNVVTIN